MLHIQWTFFFVLPVNDNSLWWWAHDCICSSFFSCIYFDQFPFGKEDILSTYIGDAWIIFLKHFMYVRLCFVMFPSCFIFSMWNSSSRQYAVEGTSHLMSHLEHSTHLYCISYFYGLVIIISIHWHVFLTTCLFRKLEIKEEEMNRMKGRRRHKTIKIEIDIETWNGSGTILMWFSTSCSKEILIEFEIYFFGNL